MLNANPKRAIIGVTIGFFVLAIWPRVSRSEAGREEDVPHREPAVQGLNAWAEAVVLPTDTRSYRFDGRDSAGLPASDSQPVPDDGSASAVEAAKLQFTLSHAFHEKLQKRFAKTEAGLRTNSELLPVFGEQFRREVVADALDDYRQIYAGESSKVNYKKPVSTPPILFAAFPLKAMADPKDARAAYNKAREEMLPRGSAGKRNRTPAAYPRAALQADFDNVNEAAGEFIRSIQALQQISAGDRPMKIRTSDLSQVNFLAAQIEKRDRSLSQLKLLADLRARLLIEEGQRRLHALSQAQSEFETRLANARQEAEPAARRDAVDAYLRHMAKAKRSIWKPHFERQLLFMQLGAVMKVTESIFKTVSQSKVAAESVKPTKARDELQQVEQEIIHLLADLEQAWCAIRSAASVDRPAAQRRDGHVAPAIYTVSRTVQSTASDAALVGCWSSVVRRSTGELETVQLEVMNDGRARITSQSANGIPVSAEYALSLTDGELNVVMPGGLLTLGTVSEITDRQMVLEGSRQVTLVRRQIDNEDSMAL